MSLRNRIVYRHYRGHRRTEEPAVEPVSVSELEAQLELPENGQSAMLEMFITAAREQCEEVTGRALITQKWKLTLDQWPMGREPWWDGVKEMPISELRTSGSPSWVIIPRYRLQSVDEIRIFGFDSEQETISDPSELFIIDTEQEPGRMVLRTGSTWPVALQRANSIEIDYTAGYGSDPSDVPAALRLAILQMAAFQFEHRGDGCSAEDAMKASGALTIFNRYKVREV